RTTAGNAEVVDHDADHSVVDDPLRTGAVEPRGAVDVPVRIAALLAPAGDEERNRPWLQTILVAGENFGGDGSLLAELPEIHRNGRTVEAVERILVDAGGVGEHMSWGIHVCTDVGAEVELFEPEAVRDHAPRQLDRRQREVWVVGAVVEEGLTEVDR